MRYSMRGIAEVMDDSVQALRRSWLDNTSGEPAREDVTFGFARSGQEQVVDRDDDDREHQQGE